MPRMMSLVGTPLGVMHAAQHVVHRPRGHDPAGRRAVTVSVAAVVAAADGELAVLVAVAERHALARPLGEGGEGLGGHAREVGVDHLAAHLDREDVDGVPVERRAGELVDEREIVVGRSAVLPGRRERDRRAGCAGRKRLVTARGEGGVPGACAPDVGHDALQFWCPGTAEAPPPLLGGRGLGPGGVGPRGGQLGLVAEHVHLEDGIDRGRAAARRARRPRPRRSRPPRRPRWRGHEDAVLRLRARCRCCPA
jgi:hypothetical protein